MQLNNSLRVKDFEWKKVSVQIFASLAAAGPEECALGVCETLDKLV